MPQTASSDVQADTEKKPDVIVCAEKPVEVSVDTPPVINLPDAEKPAPVTPVVDVSQASIEAMTRRQQIEDVTRPGSSSDDTPGLRHIAGADQQQAAGAPQQQAKPEVDMSAIDAEAATASSVGQQIVQALSVTASPQVNNAALRETLALVNAIRSGLSGIGAAVQQAHASLSREMNRNFADRGTL